MSDLWDGISFKLNMAHFYLGEMRKDLIPANADLGSNYDQSRQTSTVLPANQWAWKFYYHVDAFLFATRSVDFVITTTFGMDRILEQKRWIASLPTLEQTKRHDFQKAYDLIAEPFRTHLMTHIRNVSIHRSGTPPIEVAVLGRWGVHYRGGPTRSLPTHEQPHQPNIDDPNHPLTWMQQLNFAIEPGPNEFIVQEVLPDGSSRDHLLFQSCDDYLQSAGRLVEDAKSLAKQLHINPVTPPPMYVI